MFKEEHLKLILEGGIGVWNEWREANPSLKPDLSGANLTGVNLAKVNLVYANLKGAFLSGANLLEARLNSADLREATLTKALLIGADLTMADLSQANCDQADFHDTRLRGANFQGAILRDAIGLAEEEFGDTILLGASLPEEIKNFESLKTVEGLFNSCRNLFLTNLLVCVVSWITLSSATDSQLLTNSAVLTLPIIGTQIPIVGFFVISPLLIFCINFYFHFNLQRLWQGFSELPAIFPNGISQEKRYPSWLFNIRLFLYFSNLKNNKPPLFRLQLCLTSLLTWWLAPLLLYLLWGRFLCRHDLIISIVQSSLFIVSLLGAGYFSLLSSCTLRGEKHRYSRRYSITSMRSRVPAIIFSSISTVLFALLIYYSAQVTKGIPNTTLNSFLRLVGTKANIDIRNQDVSVKPGNWPLLSKENDSYKWVKGADLSGRNLSFMMADKAFFMNTNLEKARLFGATLSEADLRMTQINGADLRETDLSFADLSSSSLGESDLAKANLLGANLKNADLFSADLSMADLGLADLSGSYPTFANFFKSNLSGANLKEADFRGAKNLTVEQLSKTYSLQGTRLDPDLEAKIKERYPYLLTNKGERKAKDSTRHEHINCRAP